MSKEIRAGEKRAEGKTKIIFKVVGDVPPGEDWDVIKSKDDCTAGDGAMHDVYEGKAVWSTTTTCNVYKMLKECGLPVAFQGQLSPTEFLAEHLEMIPLEVIVRRKSFGSNKQRYPHIKDGTVFPKLTVQFHLKTKGGKWGNYFFPDPLGKEDSYSDKALWHLVQAHRAEMLKTKPDYTGPSFDDPIIEIDGQLVKLYNAHLPMGVQKPFLTLSISEVLNWRGGGNASSAELADLNIIAGFAMHSFLILEKCWHLQGFDFLDCKFEFGLYRGWIYLGDVLDADSWRPTRNGQHISKEAYRQGAKGDEMAAKFSLTAELSKRFCIPEQMLVLWNGSPKDDSEPFRKAFDELTMFGNVRCSGLKELMVIIRSMHKETEQGCEQAHTLAMLPLDLVFVTNVGRSNGAGPTLAANLPWPVISTTPGFKEFPWDVFSSLRTPGDNPLMTVVDAGNAILAALQCLAMRNPALYAILRMRQEKRFVNRIGFSG